MIRVFLDGLRKEVGFAYVRTYTPFYTVFNVLFLISHDVQR